MAKESQKRITDMTDPDLLFIEQDIPHYRVPVLKAIAEGVGRNIAFYYGSGGKEQSFIETDPSDMPFSAKYIPVKWIIGQRLVVQNYSQAFSELSKRKRTVVVRHNPRSIYLIPFLLKCKFKGYPLVVWGQGYSRKRKFRPYIHPLDFINLLIVKLSDAYVAYTPEIADKLSTFVDQRKIFTAPNTLDLNFLEDTRNSLVKEGKCSVKCRLGLKSDHYLVYCGRLQQRKRVDDFIRVLDRLQKHHSLSIGGFIIGKGPDDFELKKLAKHLQVRDLHFLGSPSFEECAAQMYVSDILLLPGWLGLAVNHAFFFGLPVVSIKVDDDLSNHGPEAIYVKHGYNGIWCEEDSLGALTKSTLLALRKQSIMSCNARDYFKNNLSISSMIGGFCGAFDYAESLNMK